MPLNPQTAAFFSALAAGAEGHPATHEQEPSEARQGYRALAESLGPGPEVGEILNQSIPGGIPVRIYKPVAASKSESGCPALIFFHGGGWVIGDLDTHDRECRHLCVGAGCLVISVDYRLAPEHPFPAGHDDCWAATLWLFEHAHELGVDKMKIAVGGDSAGGNLAAFVALKARDENLPLVLQLLIYPATDLRGHDAEYQGERFASLIENADAPVLTRASLEYFSRHLAGTQDQQTVAADWRMSPLLAESHEGVAPAFIATCEFDPIRDEGNAYAEILLRSGVAIQHKEWPGQPHLLFQLSPVLDDGKALLKDCIEALRVAFH